MGQIKGKQIKNDSLDLEKIRSGSKILPDTATLGSDKTISEIVDVREFTTKDYVDSKINTATSNTTTLAGAGLSGDSTSGIINVNVGSGIAIESDSVVLNIQNYSDSDKISLTTTNTDGISLIASNGYNNITANSINLYSNGTSATNGIVNIVSTFNTNITSSSGNVNIIASAIALSSPLATLHLNGGGLYTDVSGTNGGFKYAADYSSTYTNRSLVDKAYVDNAVSGSALNQNIWLEQTGFSLSGTSGAVTYGGTFTYPINAVTDADIFINGVKLKKQDYYFDSVSNYKPTTTSTLYFDLTYLPYIIDVDDYVEIKYLS